MLTQQPLIHLNQYQVLQDESHLRLLSIFHYVLAGLYGLGLGFLILHGIFMAAVFASGMTTTFSTPGTTTVTPGPSTMPEAMIGIMVGFYLLIGLSITTMIVCNILSARFIAKRTNSTFSYVIAGINCIQCPFGTALGVFTFIILSRASVKMQYDAKLTRV